MQVYFNGTLFKRNLKRFWPLAVVSFLAALLIFVIPEVISQRDGHTAFSQYGTVWYGPKDIMSSLAIYCSVVAFTLSIFSAIAVFGYLHNPKAAGFVSSLPVSRIGLYITNWLSGLALILAPALLVGVFYGFLLIGQPVPPGDFLRWIGALIASHLIFYSIAVFLAFLTGNPVMQAFLYGMFNFICYALYFVGIAVTSMFVFGYSSALDSPGHAFVFWLTPPAAILDMIRQAIPMIPAVFQSVSSGTYFPPLYLLWVIYLIFAALMTVFGYLLYKRRHIESTGEIIVHKPVKSIFKYLIGLFSGVILALIMTLLLVGGQMQTVASRMGWFTGFMIVFGLLGCLFTEMLIRKRLNVWKTAYKGMIVFALSVIAVMLFIRFDGSGFERRVPDQKDVVSVSFSASPDYFNNNSLLHRSGEGVVRSMGDNWRFTGEYIERQQSLGLPLFNEEILNEIKQRTPDFFESPDAIATAIELHRSLIEAGWVTDDPRVNVDIIAYTFKLTYTLENGRIMVREYALPMAPAPEHDSIPLIIELYNKPEALNKRNRFIDIPDDLILAVSVSGDVDGRLAYDYYPYGLYQTVGVSRDDYSIVIKALRQDHAAGTLGRMGYTDIISSFGFNFDWPLMTTVDLILDFNAAGVPWAFESSFLLDENGNVYPNGLYLSVIINSEQVNTIQVLQELELLP